VAQHLTAWAAYRGGDTKLYYWRTPSGAEVDFVVYGKNDFCAIEVKNSSKVRDEYLSSLLTFKNDYPECKTIFLYRGKEKLVKKDIVCMPCDEFFKKLDPAMTW